MFVDLFVNVGYFLFECGGVVVVFAAVVGAEFDAVGGNGFFAVEV